MDDPTGDAAIPESLVALVAQVYGEMQRLTVFGQLLLAHPDEDLSAHVATPQQAADAWRFVLNDLEAAHRTIVVLAQEIERLQNRPVEPKD